LRRVAAARIVGGAPPMPRTNSIARERSPAARPRRNH
jgi:hypothetical protein